MTYDPDKPIVQAILFDEDGNPVEVGLINGERALRVADVSTPGKLDEVILLLTQIKRLLER